MQTERTHIIGAGPAGLSAAIAIAAAGGEAVVHDRRADVGQRLLQRLILLARLDHRQQSLVAHERIDHEHASGRQQDVPQHTAAAALWLPDGGVALFQGCDTISRFDRAYKGFIGRSGRIVPDMAF